MKEKDDHTAETAASIFGEVIHAYSRQQAIEDGVLIAVDDEVRRDAGFRFPVAFTSAAWASTMAVDPDDDETERLEDLLQIIRFAINRSNEDGNTVQFRLGMLTPEEKREQVRLKAVCWPGDDLAPVITIMLAEED